MSQEDDVDVVATKNKQIVLKKTNIDVSSLVYQKINGYLSKKHPDSNLLYDEKIKEIDYIFSLGIDQAEKELQCGLLFDEKKPRKDCIKNMGKIANEFLLLHEYPIIHPMSITRTINKVMG